MLKKLNSYGLACLLSFVAMPLLGSESPRSGFIAQVASFQQATAQVKADGELVAKLRKQLATAEYQEIQNKGRLECSKSLLLYKLAKVPLDKMPTTFQVFKTEIARAYAQEKTKKDAYDYAQMHMSNAKEARKKDPWMFTLMPLNTDYEYEQWIEAREVLNKLSLEVADQALKIDVDELKTS